MESVNYTYQSKWVGGSEYWQIIDMKGDEIARAFSEESAELIVAALNGVAP